MGGLYTWMAGRNNMNKHPKFHHHLFSTIFNRKYYPVFFGSRKLQERIKLEKDAPGNKYQCKDDRNYASGSVTSWFAVIVAPLAEEKSCQLCLKMWKKTCIIKLLFYSCGQNY